MTDSSDQDRPFPRRANTERFRLIIGAIACVLFGVFIPWCVHALWQLDDTPVTSTFQEQMMHRKSKTMGDILDGLVRGNLRRVEESAEHMKSIGININWYSSKSLV